eukprot:jgi/Mesvir1/167/Mv13526-RA.1
MVALTLPASYAPCDQVRRKAACVAGRLQPLSGGLRPGKLAECFTNKVNSAGSIVKRAQHSMARAESASSSQVAPASSRRELLLSLAAATAVSTALFTRPALSEESLKQYEDEIDKFKITVPSGWAMGEGGATAQRRVVAFYPPDDPDSNVSIITTNVGADHPTMGSFGDAYGFGFRLVGGLDRRNAKERPQKAVLLDTKSRNDIYYVEYTLEQPGVFARDLYSATGIGFNGTYNRLYTVTGQCRTADREKFQALIKQIVNSFELPTV